MSLVVTGATGHIGSRVAQTHPECDWKVYCLLRPGNAALWPCLEAVPLEGDAKHPCAQSERIRDDLALNLAANAPSMHRSPDVEGLLQGNMKLGVRQLEALSASAGGGAVFMGTSRQHDVGADYSPVCRYAAMKLALREIARYYSEKGERRR
jgi:nucleoside-diphosphate-sugar epimerase